MTVLVNGQSRDIPEGSTLQALLQELGLDRHPCAAEINKQVIPKRDRENRLLKPGDTIELVTLVGGG